MKFMRDCETLQNSQHLLVQPCVYSALANNNRCHEMYLHSTSIGLTQTRSQTKHTSSKLRVNGSSTLLIFRAVYSNRTYSATQIIKSLGWKLHPPYLLYLPLGLPGLKKLRSSMLLSASLPQQLAEGGNTKARENIKTTHKESLRMFVQPALSNYIKLYKGSCAQNSVIVIQSPVQ